MKNVNDILQQEIYDLILAAITPVPVYYPYLPAYRTDNVYVTINAIANVDASTQSTSDTDTTIQISIYSRDSQANSGSSLGTIAAAIYGAIYPDRQTKLSLTGFQNCSIQLVNDITTDALMTNNFVYLNRFITFRFNIFHN
jgi:hypothetical protein